MTGGVARDDRRLRGNRIWIVPAAGGSVLQKFYAPHASGPSYWARLVLERLARIKTPTTVASRQRTERELLRVWAESGCDVPADLTAVHPALVHPRVTLLEHVRGPLLGRLLAGGRPGREERDELLTRFAAAWGRRHGLAVDRGDARLVQEHGTLLHVIVADRGLVTIDLEQAFLPRRDVLPLVAKEIVAYVRSLAKGAEADTFRADLTALVAAYPRRELLAGAVREYLDNPHPLRRLLWRLDRRTRRDRRRPFGKYRALEELRDALDAPRVSA